MPKPNVPFRRPLYPPDAPGKPPTPDGPDIVAVKRAISRAGYWPWKLFDDSYSNGFAHGIGDDGGTAGVQQFQRANEIDPTGWYGKATHEALVATRVPRGAPHAGEWVFDSVAVGLYNGSTAGEQQERIAAIARWCDYLVAREPQIGYDRRRPIQPLYDREEPIRLPADLDCSGGVIYVAWLAGVEPSPDPIYGYGGYGNTDSLAQGGTRIPEDEAPTWARTHLVLSFYGTVWDISHVTLVLADGRCWSMGSEGGPLYTQGGLRYRRDRLGCRAYPVVK